MPRLPLAKCPKGGALLRPPVSNDIAAGPHYWSAQHCLEDSDSLEHGRARIELISARDTVAVFMHGRVFRSFQRGGTS